MRCKEWYGWHFPELGKIITDNLAYAKTVKLMGTCVVEKRTVLAWPIWQKKMTLLKACDEMLCCWVYDAINATIRHYRWGFSNWKKTLFSAPCESPELTWRGFLSGDRVNCSTCDFSSILTEEVEKEMKEACEISMGTEVSEIDIENIKFLCDQVWSSVYERIFICKIITFFVDMFPSNIVLAFKRACSFRNIFFLSVDNRDIRLQSPAVRLPEEPDDGCGTESYRFGGRIGRSQADFSRRSVPIGQYFPLCKWKPFVPA